MLRSDLILPWLTLNISKYAALNAENFVGAMFGGLNFHGDEFSWLSVYSPP